LAVQEPESTHMLEMADYDSRSSWKNISDGIIAHIHQNRVVLQVMDFISKLSTSRVHCTLRLEICTT